MWRRQMRCYQEKLIVFDGEGRLPWRLPFFYTLKIIIWLGLVIEKISRKSFCKAIC